MSKLKNQASRNGAWTLAVLLLAASGPALSDAAVPGVDQLIREVMTQHRLPSLSVAVAKHGEIVYAGAHGEADIENEVPASPSTVYRLGSVSKAVTAVAALSLVEKGKIDLDKPVQEYCAAFPEKPNEITVRQLLAHLGGIGHYDYRRFDEDFLNKRAFGSIEEAAVPNAARLRAAQDLLAASEADQIVENLTSQLGTSFQSVTEQMGIAEEQKAVFERQQRRLIKLLEQEMSWEKLKPRMAELYAEVYTEEELVELTQFYRLPIGKKFLSKMPELMQASMKISREMMQSAMPKIQELHKEIEQDLKQK